MSGGKGGKPPAPPDYVGAAREQGVQNLEAIRAGAALNRVNQSGPTGSTTYRDLGNDQWEQTTSLTDDQQRIFDQSEQNQIDLGQVAGTRLDQVGQQGQFSYDGLPSQVSGVQGSQFRTDINAPSVGQTSVDLSGLAEVPTDTAAQRKAAEDAVYASATRQLDPQFQQRDDAARTRLINQGVREGSEAWNTEMANMERERQAAYGDARDRAIMAGGDESSRMLTDALRSRQQGVSERFGTGQFSNDATAQQFQNEMARTGMYNQTEGDRFSQDLTNAQLQNEARTTGANERLTERQVPLQEFMQMYGGYSSPMSSPGVAQAGTPQAGDYQGAVQNQYNAQSDLYNWNQQRNAQNTNAMLQLASLFAR